MELTYLSPADSLYPPALQSCLAGQALARIAALGNLKILGERRLALFCSVKCPGDLILKTYDAARELRDASVTIIGGFHSPMEKECLALSLRGRQPRAVEISPIEGSLKLPRFSRGSLGYDRIAASRKSCSCANEDVPVDVF